MNQEITAPRRQKLAELLGDGDNVILFAKPQPHLEKFSQDSNFLYFTGLKHPELIYIAGKFAGKFNDMLLIERSNPEREVWEGKKLTAEEARDQSGIQRIHYVDEYLSIVGGICQLARRIFVNFEHVAMNKPVSYPMFMLEPVRQRFPQIEIAQINTLIHNMRAIKSDWEVMQLQKAIDITGKGILDILENARAGMMEYEL
ncbi:MAG TPA: aminopeptidase P N-terminal domain-containing protein, partial [Candidatus Cloacimonadota bacterium]|nr:aminopeptidase P N-terminal domain-containing protein [Candidatus Cloacimonadota bacterium]